MTPSTKPWLPRPAFAPDRVRPILNRMLAEWSSHWFASAQASAEALFAQEAADQASGASWRSVAGIASVALAPPGEAVVAGAMLGANLPAAPCQEADRELLVSLAGACADDLLARLAAGRSGDASAPAVAAGQVALDECGWWEVSLNGGRRAFRLALTVPAMIGLVRRGLPSRARGGLGRRGAAVAAQKVEIAADLGRCSISLADLNQLGVGDVIILDRSSSALLNLSIDGLESPLRASLEPSGEHPVVVLASSSRSIPDA